MWLHAHESNPDLLDIEESGWTISGKEINQLCLMQLDLSIPDLCTLTYFVGILCCVCV